MKKIFISGVAGFIGTNLSLKLLEKGYGIFGCDNFYTGSKKNIEILNKNKNFDFIEHDITKTLKIKNDFDIVINLACPASPPKYQKDPIYTLDTNILGTKNLLNFAKKNNSIFLQASTSEVYGDPLESPQKEDYWGNVNPIGIRSCYDEGKRVAETYCLEFNRKYSLDVRVIRIFNTYGPFMDKEDGRVVTNFINQALNLNDLTIYGDGSKSRSFTFIDDLVDGIIKYLELNEPFFGPINLGNNKEFTVKQLANEVLDLTKSKSKIVFLDAVSDDPKQRRPDISRAKKMLNWSPKIELTEGLKKTIEYFRKNK